MNNRIDFKRKDLAISLAATFAVIVLLCICFLIVPSFQQEKVSINDLTPLADVMMDPDAHLASINTIKLDVAEGEDFGTISIRFKNTENGDKYLVDFTFDEGYVKNATDTLPAGEYKLKLVNSGSLKKSKALPKTIVIGDKESDVISFK